MTDAYETDWDLWYTGEVDPDGGSEVVATIAAPIDDDWQVKVTLQRVDGEIVVTGMAIAPIGEPAPLNHTSVFRRLRLRDLHEQIAREIHHRPDVQFSLPRSWFETFVKVPRPGRRGRSLRELAIWVDRYLTACERNPKSPVKDLVAEHHVSAAAINRNLDLAEQKQLITGRTQGKAGGTMTDECRRLLDGAH